MTYVLEESKTGLEFVDYIPGDFTIGDNDKAYSLAYNPYNTEATEALVHVYSLDYYDSV